MRFLPVIATIAFVQGKVPTAPAWLEPPTLIETVNAAIERTHHVNAVAEMPDGSLILRSPNEYLNSEFRGVAKFLGITFEEFEEMMKSFMESPRDAECIAALDMWFDRPQWYVPRKAEIISGRICVEEIFSSMPEVLEDSEKIVKGSNLLKIVASIVRPLYSDEADYIINSEGFLPQPDMKRYIGMKRFVSGIAQIMAILDSQDADAGNKWASLSGADFRYLQRMMNKDLADPMMVHFPSFVDENRSNLDVWRVAMSVEFDELDKQSVLSRKNVLGDPSVETRPRILSFPDSLMGGARRGWMETADVIRQIDQTNDSSVYKNCLPLMNEAFVEWRGEYDEMLDPSRPSSSSSLLDAFDRGHETDERIYENTFMCVLSAIKANHVSIKAEHVPGLMFLARIANSAASSLM